MDSLSINIKNYIINKDTNLIFKDTIVTNINSIDYTLQFNLLLILIFGLILILLLKKINIVINNNIPETKIIHEKSNSSINSKEEINKPVDLEQIKNYIKINKIEETNL